MLPERRLDLDGFLVVSYALLPGRLSYVGHDALAQSSVFAGFDLTLAL
jgi:hypothetical protein